MPAESSVDRAQLVDALAVQLGRRHSGVVIAFHQAVAEQLGVNATDLKALDLATIHGSTTAGQVAEATGLTTGAVTFLVDRLERAGFLTRTRDPHDRRRWTLTVTSECAERVTRLYEPLANDMRNLAHEFSTDELQAVSRYLVGSDAILERHTTRLRNQPAQPDVNDHRP